MELSLVYYKNNNFVSKSIGNEKVLVPLTDNVADMNKVYNLNEVGSFIYDCINGSSSLREILSSLIENYEVSEEIAMDDINNFITLMVAKGVLFTKQ
ncbi:PqqD family protein [Labilibacter marinus]|uniref:PqqD family protein n=1 Tax=Labilibacter marinus TaxID=1477105 RepID=UPI00094FAD6F|nr:PqqD family protein [Labilibacter marinus]